MHVRPFILILIFFYFRALAASVDFIVAFFGCTIHFIALSSVCLSIILPSNFSSWNFRLDIKSNAYVDRMHRSNTVDVGPKCDSIDCGIVRWHDARALFLRHLQKKNKKKKKMNSNEMKRKEKNLFLLYLKHTKYNKSDERRTETVPTFEFIIKTIKRMKRHFS